LVQQRKREDKTESVFLRALTEALPTQAVMPVKRLPATNKLNEASTENGCWSAAESFRQLGDRCRQLRSRRQAQEQQKQLQLRLEQSKQQQHRNSSILLQLLFCESNDSEDQNNSAQPPTFQTNLHMRLPRPRYAADFAASEFIPQRELIPLDETLSNGEASASASRATFSNHFDYEDDELAETGSSSHDLDAELIERSQDLLLDQFHEWHRSCNMFHVMAYHPEYLDIFLRFHNCLLRSAGPVGYAERHYLALMAASRHRCAYLAHLHAAEFIHLNGDESWLRGLEHASPKMQKLGQLCRLVAHRPWEITSDILRPLLTGADSLSQSELVHCMCILAHFTALAGFDYSWEEDGCCLVDRYLPSIGYELNERFETSFNLTYLTMGMNTNVETAPFRRAVWYYVHSIFGIRHDDYDYHLINRMLSIELKKYCKLVACAPEQVTMGHYRSAMPGFKHSEKVHVNLVIMDARVQACLLYSLRALNDHTTGQ
uniref:Sestrin-3 n=1 Tax=Macrostomum lignano TaxID=282301 RepID=A0A1I8GRX9_9PLAT